MSVRLYVVDSKVIIPCVENKKIAVYEANNEVLTISQTLYLENWVSSDKLLVDNDSIMLFDYTGTIKHAYMLKEKTYVQLDII